MEWEHSSNVLDVSFIPDDLSFNDRTVRRVDRVAYLVSFIPDELNFNDRTVRYGIG